MKRCVSPHLSIKMPAVLPGCSINGIEDRPSISGECLCIQGAILGREGCAIRKFSLFPLLRTALDIQRRYLPTGEINIYQVFIEENIHDACPGFGLLGRSEHNSIMPEFFAIATAEYIESMFQDNTDECIVHDMNLHRATNDTVHPGWLLEG